MLFADKTKLGFVYLAYSQESFAVNSQLADPKELTSFKNLPDPKWKGKIIVRDPRVPGAGQSIVTFMDRHGDLRPNLVRALAQQDLALSRDVRQALDSLAWGKHSLCLGCSYQSRP